MSPRAATRLKQVLLLLLGGVAIPALLLLVVFNLENPDAEPAATMPLGNMVEIMPETLDERDLDGTGAQDVMYETAATWIQTADPETGELAQRYRYEQLDPNPDGLGEGWFRLQKPEAELHLEDDRVITLSGDVAVVRAPDRALESGRMTGNVIVRLYEHDGDGVDFANDTPVVEATTDEAHFDSILGEVRCDGEVLVEAQGATMPGRGVTLRFNDRDEQLRVRVDHVHFIHLTSTPTPEPASPPAASPPAPTGTAAAPAATPAATPAAPPADPDFYQLTFHDNVLVRQGDAETRRTARGERLTIVFTTETQGLDDTLGRLPATPRLHASGARDAFSRSAAGHPGVVLLRLAQAAPGGPLTVPPTPEPGTDGTVITCDGGLTMTPLEEGVMRPASPEHALVVLEGAPVTVADEPGVALATCRTLRYDTGVGVVELEGVEEEPVRLVAPDLEAEGILFTLDHAAGRGGFVGRGVVRLDGGGAAVAAAAGRDPDEPSPDTEASDPVEVAWAERLDLELSGPIGEDTPSTLRRASFEGGVTVRGAEAALDTDTLTVLLSEEDGETVVEQVLATGDVEARDTQNAGALRGDDLTLTMRRDAGGNTVPGLLEVIGDVEAEDGRQTLWADSMAVTFLDEPQASEGQPQVHRLTAEGDVQIRLDGGARAYGDRLVADAPDEHAELTGAGVLIAHEGVLIDGGDRVVIDQQEQTGRWPGPGRFRSFAEPVVLDARGRLPRPDVDGRPAPEVSAAWSSSMVYDDSGEGTIELYGDVSTEMRRTPLERSTMQGEQVTIELARVGEAAPGDGWSDGDRDVKRLIARGDARLESRTWQREDNTDVPTVFYVAGAQIEYDVQTVEADVLGEGRVVIRDERDETGDGDASMDLGGGAPFSGRGTSMFTFHDRLRLRRGEGDAHVITMSGGVEALHKATDDRTASMTADRLDVTVGPPATGAAADGDAAPSEDAAELRRIVAAGSVYIRTPTQRIEGDLVDYDILEGLAVIKADPQRVVTIYSPGSTNALNAKSVRWDVRRDKITVIEPTGIGGR